jgi:putative ABC transport system substrate-binding protein
MNRKIVICLLTTALLSTAPSVEAQQPAKVPRIGMAVAGSLSSHKNRVDAFRQGLRELGYVESQNILIEYRYAEGKADRFFDFATELVRLKVDVIVVGAGTRPASAAKQATNTIPIVVTNASDPISAGLIASFARPGGNVTGLSSVSQDLTGKRLELLKETLPKVSRIAVLYEPVPTKLAEFKETETAAQSLGVQLQSLEVQSPNDFEAALKAATQKRSGAVLILPSAITDTHRKRIVELATKNGIPAMLADSERMDSGGLMSYGPNYSDMWRRAATYVDKILKGTKPADLPVERPIKFELVFNLKTAEQIGVTIPPNVLARADKVIK